MKNNKIINMKKNALLLLVSFLFFIAADAKAQQWSYKGSGCFGESCSVKRTNFYQKILFGANFLQDSINNGNKATYQPGFIIGGSLGYCWRYGLRLEAEYAFRRNAIKNIDFVQEGSSSNGYVQTSAFMANILWDLPLSKWGCSFWDIQPFIGAGMGYDFQKMHASNSRIIFNQSWDHLSWQLMTGLVYPIYRNIDITLEYKFHKARTNFYNHCLGVGLIYNL